MTETKTILIVGAGLAGAKAAEALRKEGFDGRVVLFGSEAHRPYLRPPLSKEYLRGEEELEKVFVHPEGWYAEQRVELETSTTVDAVDPAAREVVLGDGRRVGFDRLLLATGSEPRRLAVPGADLAGIRFLRTIDDSDALREAAARAHRVVVIGQGWIGAEVAASIRQLGRDVTYVIAASVPLERVLGPEVGAIYRDAHADHGVRIVPGQRVVAFHGSNGAVEAVETADGDADRRRPRGRRDRRHAADRARPGGGAGGRGRHPRRRDARDERARDLRGGRHRQRGAPGARAAAAIPALGQRAPPGRHGGPEHARPRGALRARAVLLLRPVRPQHGVRGLSVDLGPGGVPGRRRRQEPSSRSGSGRRVAAERERPRSTRRSRSSSHRGDRRRRPADDRTCRSSRSSPRASCRRSRAARCPAGSASSSRGRPRGSCPAGGRAARTRRSRTCPRTRTGP